MEVWNLLSRRADKSAFKDRLLFYHNSVMPTPRMKFHLCQNSSNSLTSWSVLGGGTKTLAGAIVRYHVPQKSDIKQKRVPPSKATLKKSPTGSSWRFGTFFQEGSKSSKFPNSTNFFQEGSKIQRQPQLTNIVERAGWRYRRACGSYCSFSVPQKSDIKRTHEPLTIATLKK